MNTIAANELKRHGINAVEQLIAKGPVHIIKRNRPVCVMLSEDDYRRLLIAAGGEQSSRQLSVREWFSLPSLGNAEKGELDDLLSLERNAWDKS
jgi:hypothetical protein